MLNVFVLGGDDYKELFRNEGYNIQNKFDILDTNLICFTGGTDVNPALYGQSPGRFTDTPDHDRDEYEKALFETALEYKIPMVGICRGAQLLHVLNGYPLYQHVEDHLGSHEIKLLYDYYHQPYMMASANHHQMMLARNNTSCQILAVATHRSSHYEGEKEKLSPPLYDPEVVWHKNTNCLCHQPHPEWMHPKSEYVRYFFWTIDNYLFGDHYAKNPCLPLQDV